MKKVQHKQIEIFCGTGGVGKTTLATARAFYLANQGLKVLLITIDPAKRLKEILGLDDHLSGNIEDVTLLLKKTSQEETSGTLHALLMSPLKTFEGISTQSSDRQNILSNNIVKILARPHGGMNEILSIVEVQKHLLSKKYDSIILDTPPGQHFLDFLESCKKINNFFDKSFMEIFKYVGKSIGNDEHETLTGAKNILSKIINSGFSKLVQYLEKVTGGAFVEEFINAIHLIYANKSTFLEALKLEHDLKNQLFSNWFLVTSFEHSKIFELGHIKDKAIDFMHDDSYILVNKSLGKHLADWNLVGQNLNMHQLHKSIFKRESEVRNLLTAQKTQILEFSDVIEANPLTHVTSLANEWKNYSAI